MTTEWGAGRKLSPVERAHVKRVKVAKRTLDVADDRARREHDRNATALRSAIEDALAAGCTMAELADAMGVARQRAYVIARG